MMNAAPLCRFACEGMSEGFIAIEAVRKALLSLSKGSPHPMALALKRRVRMPRNKLSEKGKFNVFVSFKIYVPITQLNLGLSIRPAH